MVAKKPAVHANGFTLIEVLASIVLLGITVMLFYQLLGFTALSKDRENRKDEAIQLANEQLQQKLEAISQNPALSVGTQTENEKVVNGLRLKIEETNIGQQIDLPSASKSDYVSVAGTTLLKDGNDRIPRQIVVWVRWREQ